MASRKKNKNWVLYLVGAVVLLGGLYFWRKSNKSTFSKWAMKMGYKNLVNPKYIDYYYATYQGLKPLNDNADRTTEPPKIAQWNQYKKDNYLL